ncbi:double-strand break repair helicase AddA [Jannaschia sp. W003]|uniref:double-strand break repair helicase AddA n=1 Tax=Jannaschia sp. W003 TaxID=2867012 RepID=UPI0021A3A52A|nr:double-strand break repair helicase AddA [Jannaschia sp. W003]UWQ21617.1 double-strand break repair helicase AddA [Jannaschia sp. W003]
MNDASPPPPDDATLAQIAAADPSGSVWLHANAGSGKTRVLTDRVAWLLLEGTAPERILCLTFTKAAAAEMHNRLADRLGTWAMLPDDALRRALLDLGVPRGRVSTEALQRARTLFARAIETPGGLKIQTIHAFCASLLRRFPLEAGVSPGFREMDDVAAARLLADVLEDMAADADDAAAVEALSHRLTGDAGAFTGALAGMRDALARGADPEALRRALGVEGESRAQLCELAVDGDALDLVERSIAAARADTTMSAADMADRLTQALLADPERRFELCAKCFLTDGDAPRKKPFTKKALEAFGGDEAMGDVEAFCETLARTRDALRGHDALDRALLLHDFAPRFLARLEAEKAARGWLDYDDLILRARALLSTRETAQWVLYKLDGGIDHVLVDEAQDTSQVQWDVVAALAGDFGAGESARGVRRTLFVVGDRKQSIFGFQGADPAAFDAMRTTLGRALEGGTPIADRQLLHSFRSSPAILRCVDRVFAAPSGAGAPTRHIAFREDHPGRVDLWPHVPEPETPEAPLWHDPVDRPARDAAHVVLARRIAAAIDAMIRDRVPVRTRDGVRPVEARDVLILFRARGDQFYATIEACKARGLAMAGADRLRLAEDVAVRDLLALCRFAATPEDDLSLAEVLRSPLGRLSERDLFAVAHGRGHRTLLRALRDHGAFAPVAAMLDDVLAQADFLRPYELLQRVLVRHDGRRRLVGRLGAACEEAIDGLLHQALAYEALEVPSLTGFLSWIEEAAIDLKREATGGAIRVMSIHGSKGLEAPVVIVPQCGPWQLKPPPPLLRSGPDAPTMWMPKKSECNEALGALHEAHQARILEERDRLLYVALTRAESWLICAAAGPEEKEEGTSWAGRLRLALEAEGAASHPFEGGEGLRLEWGDWSAAPEGATTDEAPAPAAPVPPWAEAPVPEHAPARALAEPSGLGGAKTLPGEHRDVIDRDAAIRHGTRVHALLEHLPPIPEADRAAAAPVLVDRFAPLERGDDAAAALGEALAVIAAHPALFGAGTFAELPFVLPAEGARPGLSGTMDRVIVEPERIRVVDYKTNRTEPKTPEAVPEGLLRQMGAYRAAARAIWPGRAVDCAILWTGSARLMALPADLVDAAWARAASD